MHRTIFAILLAGCWSSTTMSAPVGTKPIEVGATDVPGCTRYFAFGEKAAPPRPLDGGGTIELVSCEAGQVLVEGSQMTSNQFTAYLVKRGRAAWSKPIANFEIGPEWGGGASLGYVWQATPDVAVAFVTTFTQTTMGSHTKMFAFRVDGDAPVAVGEFDGDEVTVTAKEVGLVVTATSPDRVTTSWLAWDGTGITTTQQ